MRRTLPTRRESTCSQTGDTYVTNEGWIREGLISDKDPLPWLRAVQTQGFELTVVGSTPDAVRVCLEAWHAGFKPVLIIMEDQLSVNDEGEVRKMMSSLMRLHGGHGMFTYGPVPLYSDSMKCLVQLDDKGRAVDVCVCTNNGGLNTLSETWQLFKGPAIIVDPIGVGGEDYEKDAEKATSSEPIGRKSLSVMVQDNLSQKMDEVKEEPRARTADDKRRMFLSRVKAERSAVVNPGFWEDRYDPERLSFWTVGYNEIAPNLIIGLLQMVIVVAVNRQAKEDLFFLWRALADLFVEAPCANSLTILYSNTLGLHLRNDTPTLLSVVGGVGYWFMNVIPMFFKFGRYYFADFVGSSCGLFTILPALLLFCKYIKRIKITKWTLLWYCTVAAGTLGSWFGTIGIMLGYLIILSMNGIVASIFLTIFFSGMEVAQVKLMLLGYDKFVWKPRKENPSNILGDQKAALAQCITMIHCFTETGRLVSMVCGAVRADNTDFLWYCAVSVALALVINTAGRTGWINCLLARFVSGFPRQVLCPTAVMGLHAEVKFAMGWPRFFFMLGLFLGRGTIHNKWNFTLLGKDPCVWCWNGLVLITVVMAFVGELIEDWAVYVTIDRTTAPFWTTFKAEMMDRFDRPMRDDIYHPSHFLVPQSAFLAPSADSRSVPSLTSSELTQRISRSQSPRSQQFKGTRISKCVADLAPKLSVSPNFKHARYLTAMQMQHAVGGMIVMTITAMSIGLGNGNLFGNCGPIQLDEVMRLVRNSILWSDTCEAEVLP